MTDRIDPNLFLPEKPFLTAEETEQQFEDYSAKLTDGENVHQIIAPMFAWDWFLILTWDGCCPRSIMEDVLENHESVSKNQTLSETFVLYLAELIRKGEPRIDDDLGYADYNHHRFSLYEESNSHPYYDEFVDLQWRFDKKVKYPVAPSPQPLNSQMMYRTTSYQTEEMRNNAVQENIKYNAYRKQRIEQGIKEIEAEILRRKKL